MEIRHLRYFVAAIEEGSLHGAAQRMNVAQPALSRRIRDLEADVASELLIRGPRGISPTRAGTTLYREALLLLDQLDQAGWRVRRAGLDQGGEVRLGLAPTARKYRFAQQAVATYRRSDRAGDVAFTRAASADLAVELREGRLDLAMLYERHLGSAGFGERLVHRERYVLAVHPEHRLAIPAPIDLAELSGEPLVWLSRRDTEGNQDGLMQQCRLHGLEPVIAHMAQSHEEQIDLATVSTALCLTPASTMLTTPAGMLAFRPLANFAMRLHLTLAWNSDLAADEGLLRHFHGAIDRHQADIAAGRADWARLHGKDVVELPHPA